MAYTYFERRRAGLMALALVSLASAGRAQQPAPPQTPQQLPRQYPYPAIRDQRGAIPPAPRPLPAPPLGAGPWVWPTMEQRDIKVSVVTRGLSHPWSLAFL